MKNQKFKLKVGFNLKRLILLVLIISISFHSSLLISYDFHIPKHLKFFEEFFSMNLIPLIIFDCAQ